MDNYLLWRNYERYKINIYDLEKIYLALKAKANLLESWNKGEENSSEIRIMIEQIRQGLDDLENIVYGLDEM